MWARVSAGADFGEPTQIGPEVTLGQNKKVQKNCMGKVRYLMSEPTLALPGQ